MSNFADWTSLDAAYRRGGALPPTYVFEDLPGVLLDHVRRADLMLTGLAKSIRFFSRQPPSALRGCSPARDGPEPYCKWGKRNRMCARRRNIRSRSGGIVRLRCFTR